VTLPLRPDLVGIEPYGAPQLDVPVQLNTNENPYPPPERVIADVADAAAAATAAVNRYPDRDFTALRTDLAAYLAQESGAHELTAENIWAANGSNEVMLHVLQAYGGPGRRAMSFAPTYSMYPEYARDTFTEYIAGTRDEDFRLDADAALTEIARVRPAVVFLASPNNPTGTAMDLETIERIAAGTVDTGPDGAASIVLIDEAYAEFRREDTPTALSIRPRHPHLAVARTMSKAFAFAGARVGYLAAAPALIDALRVVRLPYHLSAITQAAARTALGHAQVLQASVAALRSARDQCVAWLRQEGFTVADSDANFVLFGTFPDRHAIWRDMVEEGVLIRETGPAGYLRVSIGTEAEMAAFRGALKEVTGR